MHHIINVLLQVPQVTPRNPTDIDFGNVALQVLFALLWGIIGAVVFSIVIALAMRVFSALTPGIDEMAELKKGNLAVGIIMAGYVLTVSIVVIAILIKP